MRKTTMTETERKKLLKGQNVVVDAVTINGEVFSRSSYMFAGKMYSHIHGCFGNRYFKVSSIKVHLISLKEKQ